MSDKTSHILTSLFFKRISNKTSHILTSLFFKIRSKKTSHILTSIEIEDFYDYSYTPACRYGYDKPEHQLIQSILLKGLANYERELQSYIAFNQELLRIGRDIDASEPSKPNWINDFFSGLDAIALYGMIATRKPKTFCEIGSGYSTKFAVVAKNAHSPETNIISIDPAPRTEINQICDKIIRSPLQKCDLSIFENLEPGDILFFDGSHRILQNSDVSVFFLEVLPVLKKGVIIHIHDILWPYDYPNSWAKRMYSEQYILGNLLLFAEEKINIILPNTYISYSKHNLTRVFSEIWNAPHLRGLGPHGGSFWFSIK